MIFHVGSDNGCVIQKCLKKHSFGAVERRKVLRV